MNILLIEDNVDLAGNVFDFLEPRGHDVDIAYDAEAGLEFVNQGSYDAIVLDLMLPGMDGLEMCRRLRQWGCGLPVLMLTARDTLEQKGEGFAAGADDYLVKPFALQELEMRLSALVRRSRGEVAVNVLTVGPLSLDVKRRVVLRESRHIQLARIPLQILELLMHASPAVVSRQDIEQHVWSGESPGSDVLKAHIYALRTAIDKPFDKAMLHTRKGVGFCLTDSDEF